MIKVVRESMTACENEVELVAAASRFFVERLIPVTQQNQIRLIIEVTERPSRKPVDIKWMVTKPGLFVDKLPRHFEMTVSIATGAQDVLENTANEIAHIAQVVSGRLKIYLKKRKIQGSTEQAYVAMWLNKKFSFIDKTSRSERMWEIEATTLKTFLVKEFLSWAAGQVLELPTQKANKSSPSLYPLTEALAETQQSMLKIVPTYLQAGHHPDCQPANIEAMAKISETNETNFLKSTFCLEKTHKYQPPAQKLAVETLLRNQESPTPQSPDDYLNININKLKIVVDVPGLGVKRVLDGVVLHGILRNLLERGLIPYEAARAALENAQNCQSRS